MIWLYAEPFQSHFYPGKSPTSLTHSSWNISWGFYCAYDKRKLRICRGISFRLRFSAFFCSFCSFRWHSLWLILMMTSCKGNGFCIAGPSWGESTGHRWIPVTKGQSRGALVVKLMVAWTNCWRNSRVVGALGHRDRTTLTPKHRETHGCVVSTVATDALVLKHQAISIHNAD